MKKEFTEQQKFTQWWFWALMLGVFVVPVYVFISEGFSKSILTFALVGVCNVLFFMLKLSTKIDATGIKMAFFPSVNKSLEWKEIKTVKVFDYGFVGGWGVRMWTKYGTVYNIKGSKGLLVELNNGKTFVVGTQKEDELKMFLKDLGKLSE